MRAVDHACPAIQSRLDTVFELRDMPTKLLRKIAIRRGLPATVRRVDLMRGIYWDIVEREDACSSLKHAEAIYRAGRLVEIN